jgi:hypothetical protein
MGRPSKHRGAVERAALDLLVGGVAMEQRALFSEIRRRTGASDGTIRKWARPLCRPEKRGRPGDADAAWWWSYTPEIAGTEPNIAGIEPKIMRTRSVDSSAPKMTATRGEAHGQPGTRSLHAQHRVRGHASEIAGTGTPSLLVGHHERSESEHPSDRADERQVAIKAFGYYLATRGWELHTLNLSVATGYPSVGAAVGLASWAAAQGGGIWLVPQAADDTDHEHHHGLIVRVPPALAIDRWVRFAGGTATLDQQRTKPVYALPGWLDYCRRAPGFALARVITSGGFCRAWDWALGQADHMPADPYDFTGAPGELP